VPSSSRIPGRRRLGISSAVGVLLTSGCALAVADPVTDQIDAAKRAYQNGDARVAIQALEFAAAQIRDVLEARQLSLLPEPLSGWVADDPMSETGGIAAVLAGTNLTRNYRQTGGDGLVSITITADSPVLSLLTTLMQASPASTPYTHRGYRGMLEAHEDGSRKALLMIGTRIQIQVETSGTDQQTLESYLDAMDLEGLEQALLG
jgi:hypothetical protein